MKKRTLCAVLAAVALASCAPMPPIERIASNQTCTGAQCQIDVTVAADGKPQVVDFVFVKQPTVLIWRLPQDSPCSLEITFIGAGEEFRCRSDGQRQYSCTDAHTKLNQAFKYWVKLVNACNSAIDPYIVND